MNSEPSSCLAMADVPILAIQEALGHKSIAMTCAMLIKLVPEEPSTSTTETPIATDTTATEALASIAPASKSVH